MIADAFDRLLAQQLVDEDGDAVVPRLLPSMSEAEIADAEGALGVSYPPEVSALLRRTRGIEGLLDEVDFSGLLDGQALDEIFPRTATVAHDGFGNFWAVDLLRATDGWGPIWFLSHDPPVALLQCEGLAAFLDAMEGKFMPHGSTLIDDVHDDRLFAVGREYPGELSAAEIAADPVAAEFAAELGAGWIVVDLREAVPGQGIAWGRFGPRTELRRHGALQLFAYREPAKRGLFSRRRGG
jgi:hypothetical protein